jgi:hypothetical protein
MEAWDPRPCPEKWQIWTLSWYAPPLSRPLQAFIRHDTLAKCVNSLGRPHPENVLQNACPTPSPMVICPAPLPPLLNFTLLDASAVPPYSFINMGFSPKHLCTRIPGNMCTMLINIIIIFFFFFLLLLLIIIVIIIIIIIIIKKKKKEEEEEKKKKKQKTKTHTRTHSDPPSHPTTQSLNYSPLTSTPTSLPAAAANRAQGCIWAAAQQCYSSQNCSRCHRGSARRRHAHGEQCRAGGVSHHPEHLRCHR